jgi:hypothetical protein
MHRFPIGMKVAALSGLIFVLAAPTASVAAGCMWKSVRMTRLPAPASVTSISALTPDDVWAVGYYVPISGNEHSFTERFNGNSWSGVPVTGQYLAAVRALSKTDVWSVGTKDVAGFTRTLAQHFDGSAWHSVPTPNANNSDNVFNAIAGTSSSDLWAVGDYFDPNNHATLSLAEHWNGRSWSLVPTQDVALQNVLLGAYAAAPNDVWAVGFHDNVGGTKGGVLIEHWDGVRWRAVDAPSTPFTAFSALIAADGSSPTDVWAVGDGVLKGSSTSATLSVHWDGSRWSYVQSPNVGMQSNVLLGVASDGAGMAVAVGSSDLNRSTLVERWNGTKWNVDRSALSPTYSQLNAVSLSPNDEIWAAGYAGKLPYDEFHCGR